MKTSKLLLLNVFFGGLLFLTPANLTALPFGGRTPANKLTASDGADDDKFGHAIAVSETHVVVGALFDDDRGIDCGSVYVYDRHSGAEVLKLISTDAEAGDQLGHSVAISGNLVVAGARWEAGAGSRVGAAYVFDLYTGAQLYKLVASDRENDDSFGFSVAIDGNHVLVGAPGEGNTDRGAAYFFDLSNVVEVSPGTLSENRKLQPSDQFDDVKFGRAVAVEGVHGVVGANEADVGGSDSGAAYVYDLETGEEIYILSNSDPQTDDVLGWSVAIRGDHVLVSAHGEDGEGIGDAQRGAAYLFDLSDPVVPVAGLPKRLHENHKFTASDAEDHVFYGWAVALSDGLVVIGAVGENAGGTDLGAVYVYDLDSRIEIAKLTAVDGENFDKLGYCVAATGRSIYGGAPEENGSGNNRGAAYAFLVPDFQPDAIVGASPFKGVGDDIYDESGRGQTHATTSVALRPAKAWWTIQNDGDAVDDFRCTGRAGNRDFTITYTRRALGRTSNVSAAVIAGSHLEKNLTASGAGRLISVDVRPSVTLRKKKGKKKTIILRKRIDILMRCDSESRSFERDGAIFQVGTR